MLRLFSMTTIRRKVIFAFVCIIVLMIAGTAITIYQLSKTTSISSEVINIHQPTAITTLQLVKEINLATSLLNEFLLTGKENLKKDFYLRKKVIQDIHREFLKQISEQQPEHLELLKPIDSMLKEFYGFADRLIYLRENDLENYPGLALASELTDPYTLAYLGLLNELIDADHSDMSLLLQNQLLPILYDMRYSWIQMNNAFRIFMTARGDSDIENFYAYSDANGRAHERLRSLNIELGFDAIDQLEEYRKLRLQNVPKVIKVFKDEAWRTDAYLMKTEVDPLLSRLNMALQQLSSKQIEYSISASGKMTNALDKTTMLAGLILLASILFAFFIANVITNNIKPMTSLTDRLKNTSVNNLKPLDASWLERTDEVGKLAGAFDAMTRQLIHDIRERQFAERKFEILLQSSTDATVIVDETGIIRLYNKQAEILFGYSTKEIIGHPIEVLIPERYHNSHHAMRIKFMEHPTPRPMAREIDIYAINKDGREFPIEVGLAPIETSEGIMVSAMIRDISERKATERLLIHQANYDNLTDLPNRILALDRLSHAITSARRNRNIVAVMFIDLDNFKQVNDSLGHSVGDKLLKSVGSRLSECVRANDTVARLGGDEFLVILPELKSLTATESIATNIIDAISAPYVIDERTLFIGASIGITGFPDDGDEPDVLLRNADAAMYQAKDSGRNTFRFFTSEMNAKLLHRLEIESQLRNALIAHEFHLELQPMFNLDLGRITCAEALLRWNNPLLGQIPPNVFIPIAEESGLINSIGYWVLEESCKTAQTWQHLFGWPIRVSVNISAVQFRSGDLVKVITQVLKSSGLPAEFLELEITERVLLDDNLNVSRLLSDIKRLGVSLAMDDFGTGYSSLGYLKRFPFDVLKIDRIFVSDITHNPETESLCKAIIAMAQSLNLTVVAEGVETAEQFQYLNNLGVRLMQGYFFSSPLPKDQFVKAASRKLTLLRQV